MVSDLHNVLNEDKSGAGMVEINLLQSIRLRKSDVQCLAAANFKLNNQDSELKTWRCDGIQRLSFNNSVN